MLTLTVIHGPGTPAQSARFDELGGTIGRADSNLLVLPDPGRTISRVHAQVVYRRGGYVLLDRGSNPVLLNGEPLAEGPSRELAQDDRVQLGAYTLRVDLRASQAANADDEAPTVLNLNGRSGRDRAAGTVVPPGSATDVRAAVSASTAAMDPFAAFGDWDGATDDPLGLGLAPASRRGDVDRRVPFDERHADQAIAANVRAEPAVSPTLTPLLADIETRPERRALESMFGIDENGPLGDPLGEPLTDPLGSSVGGSSSVTTTDAHADDWRQAFLPKSAATTPSSSPDVSAAPAQLAHQPVPPVPLPTLPQPTAKHLARPATASDDLCAALAEGLGLPRDQLPPLTPALAQLIGELLRDAVAGTVDMLLARATLKREVQAAATMIATRGNNPLKFSPNVDVALRHLLQPAVSGFLAPRAAMRDAFDDLRAHQVGLVAGMQGASARVLRRLDPDRMAERLRAPSLVDRALPMARKAALWERFVDEYERLGQDADEAFQAAFVQSFRAAYEEHFETLRQAGR